MKVLSYIMANGKNALLKKVSANTGLLLSRPFQVSIEPNERCNAKCLMCDCWRETKDYLTSEEILSVLKELREWIGPHFFLQIAGGEPLIFKGIFDIFRYCADESIVCKISTNGLNLTPAVCDKVIASGLKYLTVSIDSHKPEIHDKYRGVPGALDKALAGLRYLREHSDMVLGVSSIIMKENVNHLKEFTDFLLGLDIDRIIFQPVRAYGMKLSEWQNYEYWVNDLDAADEAIEYIQMKKQEDPRIINTAEHLDIMKNYFREPQSIINQRKCFIGLEQLSISYKGDVVLCNAYKPIGNIKDSSVREMWSSPKAKKVRKQMLHCKMPCTSNCKKELTLIEKFKKFRLFLKAGLFK